MTKFIFHNEDLKYVVEGLNKEKRNTRIHGRIKEKCIVRTVYVLIES